MTKIKPPRQNTNKASTQLRLAVLVALVFVLFFYGFGDTSETGSSLLDTTTTTNAADATENKPQTLRINVPHELNKEKQQPQQHQHQQQHQQIPEEFEDEKNSDADDGADDEQGADDDDNDDIADAEKLDDDADGDDDAEGGDDYERGGDDENWAMSIFVTEERYPHVPGWRKWEIVTLYSPGPRIILKWNWDVRVGIQLLMKAHIVVGCWSFRKGWKVGDSRKNGNCIIRK